MHSRFILAILATFAAAMLASCEILPSSVAEAPATIATAIATTRAVATDILEENILRADGTIQIDVYVNNTKMDVPVYNNEDSPQIQGPDNLADYVLAQPVLDYLGATGIVNSDASVVTFESQKYGKYSFDFVSHSGPYAFSNAKFINNILYVAFDMFRVFTDGSLVQDDYTSMYLYTSDFERTDIPKNLEESYVKLDEILDAENRAFLKNATEADFIGLHFELGLWIRNNWLYPKQSRLTESLYGYGLQSIDDMSTLILRGYIRYLNGKPCSIDDLQKSDVN
jgi:hypothetical protein